MDYKSLCLGLLFMTSLVKCQFPQQPPQQNFPQNQNFQPQPGMNPNQPQTFQPQPGMNPNQPQNFQPQPGMNPNQPQSFQPQPGMNPNQPQNIQPNVNLPQQPVPTQINQNVNQNPGDETITSNQQSQITCAQAGRTAVSQCFQSNGGFPMITVIGLLSNGTQGQLPQNAEQVRTSLCQSQSQIIACIFTNIRTMNGSAQCNTMAAFVRLQQETVGLLNGVQQMCGTGINPKISPCMQRLNYDLAQCFDVAGLNGNLYSQQGAGMEGAIIGGNREAARMFCDKRRELFACQNKVLDQCPGANDLQALSGSEQKSMHLGMDVLCKDTDVYVSGLVCFQKPPPDVEVCASGMILDMTQLTMKQIEEDLKIDDFFREYCKVRIANLQCDNKAWGESCKPVAVGLKAEFQCNLLPTKCKEDPAVRDLYQKACSDAGFARHLRVGPGSGASSIIAVFSTVFAFALTTSLLLL